MTAKSMLRRSLATVRSRSGTPGLTAGRATTVDLAGTVNLSGHLNFGRQWEGTNFYSPGLLQVAAGGRLEVTGKFDVFTGSRIIVDPGATLRLGSGYLNYDGRIACFSSITIGEDVVMAEQVTLRDSDNHRVDSSNSPVSAPIVIGDHVWIGLRATILKGVTVGSGSIIAAGAVVTRDVPEKSLVAGVPATVKRSDVSWS